MGERQALHRRALVAVGRVANAHPALYRLARRYGHKERLRFYRQFIAPGDIVFDVGAHIGNRTDVFYDLGATVIAAEPQAACVRQLQRRYGREPRVHIVEAAVAETEGTREMRLAQNSTLGTLSDRWIEGTQASGRFSNVSWDQRTVVPTTTLDGLIAHYGVPAFCKIDVEGYESEVLAGLSQPLGVVSIEFASELLDQTRTCIYQLSRLGATSFNCSIGESYEMALECWTGPEELLDALEGDSGELTFGDVYARFDDA